MIKKILKSIKNRTLINKILQKNPFYCLTNRNLSSQAWRWKSYVKLEKKYKYVIEDFVIGNCDQKKSNKIWVCWLQGLEVAPPLVRACVNSLYKNLKGKEVIILTEKNLADYINLPDYIMDKWKKSRISPAHFSDIIRVEILCKWGGTWVDSTVLCTAESSCDYIFDEPFFVYKYMDLERKDKESTVASNWFIHSVSNYPILMLTRELLREYWKKNNYAVDYYIFHLFFAMATRKYVEEWDKVPMYNNNSPHTLQFEFHNKFDQRRWNQIIKMSDFHKLNHHKDYSGCKNSFYDYVLAEYK